MQNAADVRELAERLRQSAEGKQPGGKEQGGKEQGGNEQGGSDQAAKQQSGNPPSSKPDSGKDQSGTDKEGTDQPGTGQTGKTSDPAAADHPPAGPDPATQQSPETEAGRILAEAGTQQALAMAQRMHAQSRFQPARRARRSSPRKSRPREPVPRAAGSRRRPVPTASRERSPARPPWEAILARGPNSINCRLQLRGPLLEGMQERGPEGYQSMIDAYFRELNKEIK